MKVYLTSFAAKVARHERFATIFLIDGREYQLNHSNVRLKAKLFSLAVGTEIGGRLYVDLDEVLPPPPSRRSAKSSIRPSVDPPEDRDPAGSEWIAPRDPRGDGLE